MVSVRQTLPNHISVFTYLKNNQFQKNLLSHHIKYSPVLDAGYATVSNWDNNELSQSDLSEKFFFYQINMRTIFLLAYVPCIYIWKISRQFTLKLEEMITTICIHILTNFRNNR